MTNEDKAKLIYSVTGDVERFAQAITGDKQVTVKYKLIDILNKIANGELKEGTKVKWGKDEYTYYGDDEFYRYRGKFEVSLWEDMYIGSLNEEVELIEPQEPTDNTKIEELEAMGETKFEYGEPVPADWVMANKINEIIRYINK